MLPQDLLMETPVNPRQLPGQSILMTATLKIAAAATVAAAITTSATATATAMATARIPAADQNQEPKTRVPTFCSLY